MAIPEDRWVRQAREYKQAYDGDSLYLQIDLGRDVSVSELVRLLGVDTPEIRSGHEHERALARSARQFVWDWTDAASAGKPDWPLVVRTVRSEKFGRLLTRVWRVSDGNELGLDLLAAGHARIYLGGVRKPWWPAGPADSPTET